MQGKLQWLPSKYEDYILYTKYIEIYPLLLPDPDAPATIHEAGFE